MLYYDKRTSWNLSLSLKASLRQTLLSKRRAILLDERQIAARTAAQLFIKTAYFTDSQYIACYFACDDEFDCLPIMKEIWRANKKCYLPVLSLSGEKKLEFVNYQLDDPLQHNQYNIFEPVKREKFSEKKLDVVLIPLVAFDLAGNRLGMGAGYYDRAFEFVRKNALKKPYLIGLAYEQQQVNVLPFDSWDVPMDGVLTEKELIIF